MTSRIGAEPTLVGGGELALDNDVEVREALSEMISLVGVPGRSSLFVDVRLAWRELFANCGNSDTPDNGVAFGVAPGVVDTSVLAAGAILRVFGAFRDKCGAAEAAFNGGNSDEGTTDVEDASTGDRADTLLPDLAVMFRTPGVAFLSPDFEVLTVLLAWLEVFLAAVASALATLAREGEAMDLKFGESNAGNSSGRRFDCAD